MSPPRITTPASRRPRPTAVVLGAGIAGLTAAHELVERGFEVTVYEARADERGGDHPPVKIGGLAASQFCTTDASDPPRLRPFPGRNGTPGPPTRAVAGEHGFRFFPAYYLHIWDTLQRIPIYQQHPGTGWQPTSRTVMDNVRRVTAQATTAGGKPSLIFPRELPRTPAELFTAMSQFEELGFTSGDIQIFGGRLLRYLLTSPPRRAAELANMSAFDFLTGGDGQPSGYSAPFEAFIRSMPKVLAAFDVRWGDARTNLTTFLQLQLQMSRTDNKADGVLNGPTTESWFDHWYRHLDRLGVRFVRGAAERLEAPPAQPGSPPHLRARAAVVLADGTRLTPDYVVVAVDAPHAERITAPLRAAGTGGTVVGLAGFTTSVAPPQGPLQPATGRPARPRDPCSMGEMGRVPWDRFQTLAGIQYYFDTEFQLVRGHMYYPESEWGLSSINQHGLWEQRPSLADDAHVSVLSVDIGDFNTPSRHLLDAGGRGRAARDCTADELAAEVWRQIVAAVTSDVPDTSATILPTPIWYALDRNLVLTGAGDGHDRPIRNEAPYLVPIVGDWSNRPAGEPWNPNGTSWITRPIERQWLIDLDRHHVWQARHGGYPVHHNSVVFAGTWTRTFTRITSMEAACESARHAVNAVLDHYVWVESGGADRREHTTITWRAPFGFLEAGTTGPVRLPSPAGDYCFVFDVENREPLETRPIRNLDARYFTTSLPHPFDTGGTPMATSSDDYTGQLLGYLQAWRQYLEHAVRGGGLPQPPTQWPPPMPPTMPPMPPMPPPMPPPAAAPAPHPAAADAGPPLTWPSPVDEPAPEPSSYDLRPDRPRPRSLYSTSLYSPAPTTSAPTPPTTTPSPGTGARSAFAPPPDAASAPARPVGTERVPPTDDSGYADRTTDLQRPDLNRLGLEQVRPDYDFGNR